jgi:Leucine-rich repeat (LRR) protein
LCQKGYSWEHCKILTFYKKSETLEALEYITIQAYLTNSFVLEWWELSCCKNAHLHKNPEALESITTQTYLTNSFVLER